MVNINSHTHTHTRNRAIARVTLIIAFGLMSMNGFSQNAIGDQKAPGYSGWLFHKYNLMLGSKLEPQNYLHIHNDSTQNAFLQITNLYTHPPKTELSPNDGLKIGIGTVLTNFDAIINQQEDANLFFYTNNLQRVVIDSNGFVGIGDITPTATLDVDGSFRLRTGANDGYVLKSDAQGNASWQTLNDDDPGNEIQDISLNGTSLSITGGSTVDLSSFLDNTDAQTLSVSGHNLSISNGNTITLQDDVDDADADPTNEIQTLSYNNGQLSISGSGGNTISLDGVNYWSKNNDVVYYNNGRVGIGTNTPHHNLQIYSTEQVGGFIGTSNLGKRNGIINNSVDYGAIQLTNHTTGNTANDGLLIETRGNTNCRKSVTCGFLASIMCFHLIVNLC